MFSARRMKNYDASYYKKQENKKYYVYCYTQKEMGFFLLQETTRKQKMRCFPEKKIAMILQLQKIRNKTCYV